ncbi:hypothetical protein [Catenulispora yoronensis]|uniref:hypothetical protein n=1 Tax=Catenulispora yoronensis TaxID=450799 RepID=UPI0031DF385B
MLPYRVPRDDAFKAESWRLVTGDVEAPMSDALSGWDYQLDLHLRRTVSLDLDRVRSESGLPDDCSVLLVAVWTATGSNLRGPGCRVALTGGGWTTATLDVDLRGADLGGTLLLDTAVVLAERREGARPSSPRRAGSVLWSDRKTLRLQGDAPMFPMAVIDFALTSFPEAAAWHLQISGTLENAAMGSLLLLVNEKNAVTTAAFTNAGDPRPTDRIVLSAVYADTARVMMEHALAQDEFVDEAEFPDDSLGATFLALFDRIFPGRSIADVRLQRAHSPSLFASELQAAVKIFEGR